jgi:hypothetical protein
MERYSSRGQYKAGAAPLGFRGIAAPAGCVTSTVGRKWLLPLHGGSCFIGVRAGGCPPASNVPSTGWARPEPANPGTGRMKGTPHGGQIRSESPGIAGTDPDGSPPRTARNDTHRSVDSCPGVRPRSGQFATSGSSLPVVQPGPDHPKVVHPRGSQRGSHPRPPRSRLMVFRSVGSSRPITAATCHVAIRGRLAEQDRPPYIPHLASPAL